MTSKCLDKTSININLAKKKNTKNKNKKTVQIDHWILSGALCGIIGNT